MKNVEINGVQFEVSKRRYTRDEITSIALDGGRNLYHFYDRPSHAKESIYQEWLDWSHGVNGLFYWGVRSANTFQFTLGGIIENDGNVVDELGRGDYVVYITASHNRLYEVV